MNRSTTQDHEVPPQHPLITGGKPGGWDIRPLEADDPDGLRDAIEMLRQINEENRSKKKHDK